MLRRLWSPCISLWFEWSFSVVLSERNRCVSSVIHVQVLYFHSRSCESTNHVLILIACVSIVPVALLSRSLGFSQVQHSNQPSHSSLPISSNTPLVYIKVKVVLRSHALSCHPPLLFLRSDARVPLSKQQAPTPRRGIISLKLRYIQFTMQLAHEHHHVSNFLAIWPKVLDAPSRRTERRNSLPT